MMLFWMRIMAFLFWVLAPVIPKRTTLKLSPELQNLTFPFFLLKEPLIDTV